MSISSNKFTGDFFDENYFEKGRETGKSWYTQYKWMPQRSFREALALIDYLHLDENSYVLDVGCAFGFLVRALRELEIRADGCDISNYAISHCPEGCWNCSDDKSWDSHSNFGYTNIIIKDVLEHLSKEQLETTLNNFSKVTNKMFCVVPLGSNGKYNIPEYELDQSHIIRENESFWYCLFEMNGWKVKDHFPYLKGIKDNWAHCPDGNHVYMNHLFTLEN